MRGNSGHRIVIQKRDRELLRELGQHLRVIDREQGKIFGGFGSTTRVNARLLALTRAGLLRRFFLGTTGGGSKALYALSAKGARLMGLPLRGPQRRNDEPLSIDFFITHQLTVNAVYGALKYGPHPEGVSFGKWLSFFASILSDISLIPDGYVELATPAGIVAGFLEIDLGNERGSVWSRKVEEYFKFGEHDIEDHDPFHRPFRILVIAHSERRLESIREAVKKLTEKTFWFASLESIRRDGIFAPVWLRPTGDDRHSLIEETI